MLEARSSFPIRDWRASHFGIVQAYIPGWHRSHLSPELNLPQLSVRTGHRAPDRARPARLAF
jgi:hypothetical protein